MKISKYISEFLGTGFLFCAVVGSGIMAENLSNDNSIILLINAIVTFFALYFLITAFESFSNQFNPVVSFVLFLNKEISLKIFCIFCLLQTFGAITGVMIANIMFGMDIIEFSEKNRFGSNIFLSEIIASFGLVFFILISNKAKIPLVVASYIGAAYWFTSSTSFANPAGTIGRMFSNSFAGINPENVLYFCIAQIIGGIFAFLIYRYFFKTN
ncbi:MAG: aquaporin [Gammaproteobacteria bacterium]|jgi:Glycerol uptake facilitator and related permeases (Major Intrinsic Protein Family)|tara:strand:+ start:189 stop:827 length:639 start_codon:yes stop_codon:yes gene_type:complete